ncbi:MAG: glycoside hydrolase family 2 [Clostridia bacterium]|nr:glycoside hydrolase family 2 [Clostridia bacterium]
MLKTNYLIDDIPLSEYPRPQMVRESYLCLNGKWDFTVKKAGEEVTAYDKQIIVPFSPECINSGLEPTINVTPFDRLYYKKTIVLDNSWNSGVTYLHFGAVDYSCEVFVNGKRVGSHEGGYTSFFFDIAPFLVEGENNIVVAVADPTEGSCGGRGKQKTDRGAYWYTAQSGIWQTVWLENLPFNHILDIKYTPDIDSGTMLVQVDCKGIKKYQVYDRENLILSGEEEGDILLKYDFEHWSPDNPKLYDIQIECGDDKVKSYFAMRSCEIIADNNGKRYLAFNKKPYFFSGLLDQGYWSDGLLTYPSDQAIIDELTMVKKMGFNTLRKHIKIEPMRWYYHCDRLGIIVWQDFVNGGGEYKKHHVTTFPFLGFKHPDDDYKYFSREDERGRKRFTVEWQETVNQLKNCPCIYMWTVFNEGWGQFDSKKIERAVKLFDPTRVVESVSGWHDYGDECDIKSLHIYYTALKLPIDSRPITLSEFGGYSLRITGHVYDENKDFSYKKFKTKSAFINAVKKLYGEKILPLIAKGLNGCIYTQLSDVEEEINGLITYDRKIIKMPEDEMKILNENLYNEYKKLDIKI